MFADMLYQYSISLNAQLAIASHTNRLRGIGYLRDRCWPPQRSPWWINVDSKGRSLSRGCPLDASAERKEIDHDGGRPGLGGITQYARLEHLSESTALHRMSAPVVFKAACALLNGRLSGQSDVLFTNLQAGRQWPFMDDAIARHQNNPSLSPATTSRLLSIASTSNLEKRSGSSSRARTAHADAPIDSILAQLNPADTAACKSARRQLLDWGPHTLGSAAREAQAPLQGSQLESHTDAMLIWHCCMLDAQTARLVAQWDGCQAGKAEVKDGPRPS